MYPSKEKFIERAQRGNLVPVYREILSDQDTPVSVYERLRTALRAESEDSYTFLLESVEGGEQVGRYSLIGGNPRELVRSFPDRVEIENADGSIDTFPGAEPLGVLEKFMSRYQPVLDETLPRFFGGAVGFLGYDAVARFEKAPLSEGEGLDYPEMLYAITDTLVIFDRVKHTIKLVANAFIEGDVDAAYDDAVARIEQLSQYLSTPIPYRVREAESDAPAPVLKSNTAPRDFHASVERAKEYIRSGDIIQVVLSQRFEIEGAHDPLDVYRALRFVNPSPYMFCLEFGPYRLVGSSPEIHVRAEDGKVQIRPIAGTRPRSADAAEDLAFEHDLLADPKECAEHVMLVDLARNDIGRVCDWGTVKVSDFMIIERYSHVMHIVSNVSGVLAPERNAYDLMRATFPAGTLSGAPKVRAMEIIAELENHKRGTNGGAVGYFGFDGTHDSCITIRTVVMKDDCSYVQAGAGIVADSDPQKEFEETQNKARGMLKAIGLARSYGDKGAS
jgi:anthranilate synthase component 1